MSSNKQNKKRKKKASTMMPAIEQFARMTTKLWDGRMDLLAKGVPADSIVYIVRNNDWHGKGFDGLGSAFPRLWHAISECATIFEVALLLSPELFDTRAVDGRDRARIEELIPPKRNTEEYADRDEFNVPFDPSAADTERTDMEKSHRMLCNAPGDDDDRPLSLAMIINELSKMI